MPLGEPRVLKRSVKTHTGLLLTKVTKLCIMDSIVGAISASLPPSRSSGKRMTRGNNLAWSSWCWRGAGLVTDEAERKARGSLSVEEYKEVRDQMIGEIEQEKEAIVAEVEPLRELKTGIDEIDTTGTKLPFGVVAIKKKDLEDGEQQSPW